LSASSRSIAGFEIETAKLIRPLAVPYPARRSVAPGSDHGINILRIRSRRSLEAIERASPADLAKVEGVSDEMAKKIDE
jgi:hypothetical protein